MSENRKTYILDTKVLLSSPYCIHSFDEHNVVIVDATIRSWNSSKRRVGQKPEMPQRLFETSKRYVCAVLC